MLNKGKTGRYFKYAIGEIILVVIGILIALSINNWNESRKSKKQELSSMKEITENLKYDIIRCQGNREQNYIRISGLDSLRTSISNAIDGLDETANIYYYALKYSTDFSQAVLNRAAYDEITKSGLIKQISSRTLVQSLTDYYERIAITVLEFEPDISLSNTQNMQKKFISYKGLEPYIKSYDSIDSDSFNPDYDFRNLRELEQLELLKPDGLDLINYYNEISQFELDIKIYNFYMSWAQEAAENLIQEIAKEYALVNTQL
jgi:hypothetical protein